MFLESDKNDSESRKPNIKKSVFWPTIGEVVRNLLYDIKFGKKSSMDKQAGGSSVVFYSYLFVTVPPSVTHTDHPPKNTPPPPLAAPPPPPP